jgi:hypothetical protein
MPVALHRKRVFVYTASMNRKEYERLKAEAQTEYRRKLEAIETVWKMTDGRNGDSSNTASSENVGKGDLQQAVRAALARIFGDFTLRHVYSEIVLADPVLAEKIKDKLPSVSSVLKRMADDNEITLVTAGRGKRASIYRRAQK